MGEVAFRCREYAGGNPAAASIVAGFGGDRIEFEPAALALLSRGYDVYTYDYDSSVLLESDPTLLPQLIREMKSDFEARTFDIPVYRHVGASLGCGIAWNFQKDSRADVEPGIYSAGGTDVARLIMRNHVFREIIKLCHKQDIKKVYIKNDFTEADLRAHWAEVHVPPDNGIVLALSDADPIIPAW